MEEADDKHVREVGVEWAVRQAEGLLAMDVPSVHFYVMQGARATSEVMRRLKR